MCQRAEVVSPVGIGFPRGWLEDVRVVELVRDAEHDALLRAIGVLGLDVAAAGVVAHQHASGAPGLVRLVREIPVGVEEGFVLLDDIALVVIDGPAADDDVVRFRGPGPRDGVGEGLGHVGVESGVAERVEALVVAVDRVLGERAGLDEATEAVGEFDGLDRGVVRAVVGVVDVVEAALGRHGDGVASLLEGVEVVRVGDGGRVGVVAFVGATAEVLAEHRDLDEEAELVERELCDVVVRVGDLRRLEDAVVVRRNGGVADGVCDGRRPQIEAVVARCRAGPS